MWPEQNEGEKEVAEGVEEIKQGLLDHGKDLGFYFEREDNLLGSFGHRMS